MAEVAPFRGGFKMVHRVHRAALVKIE